MEHIIGEEELIFSLPTNSVEITFQICCLHCGKNVHAFIQKHSCFNALCKQPLPYPFESLQAARAKWRRCPRFPLDARNGSEGEGPLAWCIEVPCIM